MTEMSDALTKEDVLKAIDDLPEGEVDLADVVERLVVLHKVRRGMRDSKSFSQEEVVREFDKPRDQRKWN